MLFLHFFNFCCSVLYLICFIPDLSLFRTLAQRATKRAKVPARREEVIIVEDEPTETTLPDPATNLQSSPQRSPQRKYMVRFPLLGAHGCSFLADI